MSRGRRHGGAGIRRGVRSGGRSTPAPFTTSFTSGLVTSVQPHPDYSDRDTGISYLTAIQGIAGTDYEQPSGPSQPTYEPTGANGLPAMLVGVDQHFINVDASDSNFSIGTNSCLMTMAIRRPNHGAVEDVPGSIMARNVAGAFWFRIFNDNTIQISQTATTFAEAFISAIPDDAWCVISVGRDASASGEFIFAKNGSVSRKANAAALVDLGTAGSNPSRIHGAGFGGGDDYAYREAARLIHITSAAIPTLAIQSLHTELAEHFEF